MGDTKVCPKCISEVPSRASICRYCRHRFFSFPKFTLYVVVICALAFAVDEIGISTISNTPTAGNESAGDQAPADFLVVHADDPKALDNRFGDDAQSSCSADTDDYLRSLAIDDFAWDDDAKGFFGVRFDKFVPESLGPDVLTLVSDRLKLSNGLGGFRHVDLYCSYNVKLKSAPVFSIGRPES